MNTPYIRRTIAVMAIALTSLASITFTPTNVGAETPDVMLYLGPATPNAHSGNVYSY
jgi:hypothetical protein